MLLSAFSTGIPFFLRCQSLSKDKIYLPSSACHVLWGGHIPNPKGQYESKPIIVVLFPLPVTDLGMTMACISGQGHIMGNLWDFCERSLHLPQKKDTRKDSFSSSAEIVCLCVRVWHMELRQSPWPKNKAHLRKRAEQKKEKKLEPCWLTRTLS